MVYKGLVDGNGADRTIAIVKFLVRLRAEVLDRLAIGIIEDGRVGIVELAQISNVELP